MLFKPKFCCQCGVKIERTNWNLLTSRRFCEFCEIELKVYDWIPKIGSIVILILGIFFIGSFFRSSDKAENISQKGLLKNSQEINGLSAQKTTKSTAEINNQTEDKNLAATPAVRPQTNNQNVAFKQDSDQRKSAEITQVKQGVAKEPVYFCGAETKKGTPCTRRVKGGGRCWQHKGKTAILPESQLSASQ